MKTILLFLAGLSVLSACAEPATYRPTSKGGFTAPAAQVQDVDAFAISFLNSLQLRSIFERREYCGYIFQQPTGQLATTPPRPGTFASCEMPAPRRGQGIIASYHTHGAYGPNYDNEVPSSTDLLSDFEFGINGYVSTPGGRVWRVNTTTRDTVQVCGRGCVKTDPGFVPRGEDMIQPRFTLADLKRRGS